VKPAPIQPVPITPLAPLKSTPIGVPGPFCHASAFTYRYDTTYASDPVVRQDLLCSRDAGSVDAPAKLGRTCVCWCVGQEGAGMRWYWAQGSGDDMRDVVLEPEGVVLGSRRC
jgi:hypothetical protein